MGNHRHLFKEAELIERLGDEAAVWTAFEDAIRSLGIEFYIYLTVEQDRKKPHIHSNIGLHDNAPTEGVFDPFLDYCCNSYSITKTGAEFLSDHPYLDEQSSAFIQQAKSFGFCSGLGIPMRLTGSGRFGGFNLGTRYDREDFLEKIWPMAEGLRLFCLIVHRRVEELHTQSLVADDESFRPLTLSEPSQELNTLTQREQEILFLLSQGFSRNQTADLCNISTHTVATHTKKIYGKLGVKNKAEATRLAFEADLQFANPKPVLNA